MDQDGPRVPRHIARLFKRGRNTPQKSPGSSESGITQSNFTVDAIAYPGPVNIQIEGIIYKKGYKDFQELKEVLEEQGYVMGIPHRGEVWGKNNAAADVFDAHGNHMAAISFLSKTDPTKGPIISPALPSLDKPRTK